MKSIRVIGLTDIERHALNSVVRLSVSRRPNYTIWQQGEGRPDILLLDGSHADSAKVAQSNQAQASNIVWIGADAPAFVHYRLQRPLQWPSVLSKMDEVIGDHAPTQPPPDFAPTQPNPASQPHQTAAAAPQQKRPREAVDSRSPIALSDFNVSGTGESGDSVPILYLQGDDSLGRSPDQRKRVLIVDANPSFRLYLKAVLSVGREILADETGNPDEALALTHETAYDSVLIDINLEGGRAFDLCKSILSGAASVRPGDTRISHPNVYFLTQQSLNVLKRMQANRAGADGLLLRPRNQEQLDALFAAVNRYAQG